MGTFLTSIYGGYFGAAQGVVLMGLFGITLDDDVQRLNAAKNVVAATINAVGAVFFIFRTTIAWDVSGLLFVGSTVGGQIGAVVGRRLSPEVLAPDDRHRRHRGRDQAVRDRLTRAM